MNKPADKLSENRNIRQSKIIGFLLHIRPMKVRAAAVKYNYTYGLGGISLFLLLVLIITDLIGATDVFPFIKSQR